MGGGASLGGGAQGGGRALRAGRGAVHCSGGESRPRRFSGLVPQPSRCTLAACSGPCLECPPSQTPVFYVPSHQKPPKIRFIGCAPPHRSAARLARPVRSDPRPQSCLSGGPGRRVQAEAQEPARRSRRRRCFGRRRRALCAVPRSRVARAHTQRPCGRREASPNPSPNPNHHPHPHPHPNPNPNPNLYPNPNPNPNQARLRSSSPSCRRCCRRGRLARARCRCRATSCRWRSGRRTRLGLGLRFRVSPNPHPHPHPSPSPNPNPSPRPNQAEAMMLWGDEQTAETPETWFF